MITEKVNDLNQQFKGKTSLEVLERVSAAFGSKIRFASSMGAEDQVIIHLIARAGLPIEIFTLDTGRMFSETYELIEKTEARYGIKIRMMFPDATQVENMVNQKGINLFYKSIENRKLCCNIRKIQPLQRALQGAEAWIAGLRREQSPTRTDLNIAVWDQGNGLIKINPLLEWSEKQVWEFIKENKIPYNALHDKGYPSIGCQPCTRAVMPGEDIRSGRWWWENPDTKECGLHARK